MKSYRIEATLTGIEVTSSQGRIVITSKDGSSICIARDDAELICEFIRRAADDAKGFVYTVAE